MEVATLNTEFYHQIGPSFDFLSNVNSKANYDQALSELKANEQKKAKKAKREEKKFYGGGERGRMIRKMKKNGHRVNNENKIKEAERAKRQTDIDAKKEKAALKRRAQKERLRAI